MGRRAASPSIVGDVSGKGTSAALYMSRFQGIVRSLHGFDLSPHDFFVRTNDLLCRDLERRSFVTALGGFFDTAARSSCSRGPATSRSTTSPPRPAAWQRLLPRGLSFGLSTA